jgi:hypothetical protein
VLHINRQDLIDYVNGVFMDFRNGKGRACDEVACERACKDLAEGKEVTLLIDSVPFSTIKLENGIYAEKRIE